MFRGVFNYAASFAGSLIAGYLARASVAVPFIVAFGFAIAALSLMLNDRFGHRDAYLIVAGTFTVLGLFAALIVRGKERAEVAEEKPLNTETSDVGADGTKAAAVGMPFAILGTILTTLGPAPFLSVLNVFARNLPLLLVLGAVGVLVWPKSGGETLPVSNSDAGRRATVASAGAGLNGAFHQYRQRMAIGTFVIGALIVGAAISAALGPFPALSVPHYIS